MKEPRPKHPSSKNDSYLTVGPPPETDWALPIVNGLGSALPTEIMGALSSNRRIGVHGLWRALFSRLRLS